MQEASGWTTFSRAQLTPTVLPTTSIACHCLSVQLSTYPTDRRLCVTRSPSLLSSCLHPSLRQSVALIDALAYDQFLMASIALGQQRPRKRHTCARARKVEEISLKKYLISCKVIALICLLIASNLTSIFRTETRRKATDMSARLLCIPNYFDLIKKSLMPY